MGLLKILVIEDLREIRELFEIFLKKRDLVPITAANGVEGIDLVKKEKPNLILIDIRLPDLNGIEVLRRIRVFEKTVKIFMLSGLYTPEQEKEVLNAGATGFINKSEGISAIVGMVVQALV